MLWEQNCQIATPLTDATNQNRNLKFEKNAEFSSQWPLHNHVNFSIFKIL